MYDDARNAPMAREGMQYPPPVEHYGQDPYGYGPGYRRSPWQMRGGYGGRRRIHSIETKPFYLTSEFLVSVLVSIGIAISAATMTAFGGWRAWILITAILVSYNLSRGIAKCGTRSRAYDPREELQLGRGMTGGDGRVDSSEQETRIGTH
jgi:hypothetical protein